MKTMEAYQAKAHLRQILDEVTRGEIFTIIRDGHPVAMLTPIPQQKSSDVSTVIEKLKVLRRDMKLTGLSVREMREEGKRF